VRDLEPPSTSGAVASEAVDLIVADLSFISLTLVIEPLAAWLRPGGDAILLVKPQFEVGAAGVRATRGVVRDDAARASAVAVVARATEQVGLGVVDVLRSPVSGADGNVEIFMWAHKAWQAGGVTAPTGEPRPLGSMGLQRAIEREVTGAT
jgi:23S rRNA (cytidine1920-2'-O)/16S rRNA (cytidine1409-2'-O)-methyltransferase